mgnify:FL=1
MVVDLRGQISHVAGDCGGAGADAVLRFELAAPSHVVIRATQATFDTLFDLHADCDTSVACDDDGGDGTLSRVDMELDAGPYQLFVEGYQGAVGTATVMMEVTPLGDGPPDPPEPPIEDAASWPGVRQGVPLDETAEGGFSVCWRGAFADELPIATIEQDCGRAVMMIGCRPMGDDTLTVAAMGLRAEVMRVVPDQSAASHEHNGVAWYFGRAFSWGFAPVGAALNRSQCDVQAGDDRMCWHTGPGLGGFRCGATQGLNDSVEWERVVLHRPGAL